MLNLITRLNTGLIICFSLVLAGCAALGEGGLSTETARIRHAVRLGHQSGKSMSFYLIPEQTFGLKPDFANIRNSDPSDIGAAILRDQVLTDVTIRKTIEQQGLPQALGFSSASAGQIQNIALFYNAPWRTLVLQRSSIYGQWTTLSELYESHVLTDIPAVPPSTLFLGLNNTNTPQASPSPTKFTVFSKELHEAFAIPSLPEAPPSQIEGLAYADVAFDLIRSLPVSENVQNLQRVQQILSTLMPSLQAYGLNWRLQLIKGPGPTGFGVPDGTLFVSDGLVETLNDNELLAIVAHLVGHEVYQHSRVIATQRNILLTSLPVGKALSLANTGIGYFVIPTGGYLGMIGHPTLGYSSSNEIEANVIAANLLTANQLSPYILLQALVKLKSNTEPKSLTFDQIHHHAMDNLFALGLLLDTGLIGR
jgi:Zn-dependent protease with chaperone function